MIHLFKANLYKISLQIFGLTFNFVITNELFN